jgi:hypothetical protein
MFGSENFFTPHSAPRVPHLFSVLSDSDEFHFGRDDSLASVTELRHAFAGPGAQWLTRNCGLRIADCGKFFTS